MKVNNMASRREFLGHMPTHELDEMLRAELQKENIDDDLVRAILGVLEEREMDYPVEINTEVTAAAEKFEETLGNRRRAPDKTRWPWALKVASILLVVGLLLFAVPQAVQAESIFEILARWTESVFEFFTPGEVVDQPEYVFETDNPGLRQIYDAVVEMGVTDPVVPMWVPDGFELFGVEIFEFPTDITLSANVKNNKTDGYILYTVIIHSDGIPVQYTKDTAEVEVIELAGIQHYIISDVKKTTATWMKDSVECSVVTDCQDEDLQIILKSIYTTEVY